MKDLQLFASTEHIEELFKLFKLLVYLSRW